MLPRLFIGVTHNCVTIAFVENTDTLVLKKKKNASHLGDSKGIIFFFLLEKNTVEE